ncbi:MAG: 5-formyltetrahydrofolate cyclo-ligase [Bdellovibrionota bacterium]
MSIEGKASLRRKAMRDRLALSLAECLAKSKIHVELLSEKLPNFLFHSIFLYFPFKNEPDLLTLMERFPHIDFSFPVVENQGGDLEFFLWKKGESISVNRWGIKEPVLVSNSIPSVADDKTLIIVPGLCMDRAGDRLGYGGGYYDRFLNSHPDSLTLGVCQSEFLFECLPRDPWDQKLKFICTENDFITIL